jgi:hypothetical protein
MDFEEWPRLLDVAFGDVTSFEDTPLGWVEGYVHDLGHLLLRRKRSTFNGRLSSDVKRLLKGQTYRQAIHEEVLVIGAELALMRRLAPPYFSVSVDVIEQLYANVLTRHGRAPSQVELQRRAEVKAKTKRAYTLGEEIDKEIRRAVEWGRRQDK